MPWPMVWPKRRCSWSASGCPPFLSTAGVPRRSRGGTALRCCWPPFRSPGRPLLGFLAKEQLGLALSGPPAGLLPGAALPAAVLLLSVGTAAVYARLWRLPGNDAATAQAQPGSPGALLLVAALLLLNLSPWALEGWRTLVAQGSSEALLKSAGLLLAGLGLQRLWPKGPDGARLPDLEGLDDLLGGAVLVGAALVLLLGR